MRAKIIRLSDEMDMLIDLFSMLVNENFNMFVRRSLIIRVDDLGPALLDRLRMLDFLLSQEYGPEELYGKLLSLGLTPQSIRKLSKKYLRSRAKKKELQNMIRALIERYQNEATSNKNKKEKRGLIPGSLQPQSDDAAIIIEPY